MSSLWIITGTSSGLGKALAIQAASDDDALVYGIARREGPVLPRYVHIHSDLSVAHNLLHLSLPEAGDAARIILVNNAATLGQVAQIGELDEAGIIGSYMLNVVAPHVLANKLLRTYRSSEAKKIIINISSGAATTPYDGWSIYSSSKAALNMQTLIGAEEAGIREDADRFFAVAPGVLDTEMQATVRRSAREQFSRISKFTALFEEGKLADPAKAAAKIIEIAAHPDDYTDTICRLSL